MIDVNAFAYDLCTGTLISPLNAVGVSWTTQINDAGQVSFALPLTDPGSDPINQPILGYDGVPWKVILDSGGEILFAGIVWTTNYDSDTQVLQCTGRGLMSYYDHVVIARDYSQATYPTGIYPISLLNSAITDVYTANPAAYIGIDGTVGTSPSAGPPKIIPGYSLAQKTTVGQILSDLTTSITPGTGGIDTYLTSYYYGGVPAHVLTAISPRAGRPATSSGLFIDLGRAVRYSWPTDASQSANQVIAFGAGTGTVQPVSIQNSGIPVGGLGQPPLLQAVLSYNQIASAQALTVAAQGAVQMIGQQSVSAPTVTLPLDYGPCSLGSFLAGDDVRVFVAAGTDQRFPAGKDEFWRIVAYTVDIPNEGVPTMTLTLNMPPVY